MYFSQEYGLFEEKTRKNALCITLLSHDRFLSGSIEKVLDPLGESVPAGPSLVIGRWKGNPVILQICEKSEGESLAVRDLMQILDHPMVSLIVRASELFTWLKNHRFCGRCAHPTVLRRDEPALECSSCGHLAYPVLSPAIMVRIEKGDTILMAYNSRFPRKFFSLIAGFVEAGETLEEAVHREVMEEVGLEVENLRYFHSQSWPMPHTLLAGFIVDYKSGDIRPDGVEISDARWVSRKEEIPLPRPGSLACEMIQDFRK